MNIKRFIDQYRNYPVLFIGTGFSIRYLEKSYTWDALLSKVSSDLYESDEKYLDIKARNTDSFGFCSFPRVAAELEAEFNAALENDRNGKFKLINDEFYESMRERSLKLSRFKIHIAEILKHYTIKDEKKDEISVLKKARKNISSIITTNYDSFIEEIFDFNPLVGNNILLSNPYGSIYKIHGSVNDVTNIIITENDYEKFNEQYELIRAQMLSLFIQNPIIFLGYNIGDENIKKVLKTIFSYVPVNTSIAENVRKNFLLVEYDKDSTNKEISEHDIVIGGGNIRINKLKTDDFVSIYEALASISLPISAMDIRKVQSVVKEIYAGGTIKVKITEDIDKLANSDRILAIGSSNTISYQTINEKELIQNYFTIIEENNASKLAVINRLSISFSHYFPIFGFSKICSEITNLTSLKTNQRDKVNKYIEKNASSNTHIKLQDILDDNLIADSYKHNAIMYAFNENQLDINEVENFLKNIDESKKATSDYRRLLCLYDIKKFGEE